jgi:hypothetical protein
MARFTDEQRGYGQAMKLMIELYYQLKGMDPSLLKLGEKPSTWLSTPLVMSMAEIFYLTIPNFSPCLYFVKYCKFRYRGEGEEITITNGGILSFIEAMEALKSDISEKKARCFKIKEVIVESHDRLDNESGDSSPQPGEIGPDSDEKSDCTEVIVESHERPERGSGDSGPQPMEIGPDGDGRLQCTIVSSIDKNCVNQDEISDHLTNPHAPLNDEPLRFDSFVLDVHDSHLLDFAAQNYDIYNAERSWSQIYSPGFYAKSVRLIDAVIYLLIKYQYLFGSFERVKVCKQCNKLFFEKRLGAKEFCGGLCRKHYNDILQVPEIRHCRDRQNQWLANKSKMIPSVSMLYRVQKENCAECDGTKKSGECPALIKKNKKAFNYLAKIGS